MSYRIEYDPKQAKRYPCKRRNHIITYRVLVCLLLFCAIVFCLQAEGVREFLIPGDPDATISATANFIGDVRNGRELSDAFSAFCETVITNAAP